MLLPGAAQGGPHPAGPAFQPSEKTVVPDEDWPDKPFMHEPREAHADLVVIINQQFYDFLHPTISGFARQNNLKILVKKGTCGLAAGAVVNKSAEISSFCCPPGELDRLPGLSFHTLGIYPIALLVHPDNPVDALSWQQVQQIFTGDLRRWSQVGGQDVAIMPIARLHCKKRPGHWRLLLDHADLFSLETQEVGSIDDMYGLVREHPEAIGYEVFDGYHSRGTKSVRIDGMAPTDLDRLRAGDYPFYRVLNLTLWDAQKNNRQLQELFKRLAAHVEKYGREAGLLPASELHTAGWQFSAGELVGAPVNNDRE